MASTYMDVLFYLFRFLSTLITPFLLILLFKIPSKLTRILLNKIFPIPQKSELIADLCENNEKLIQAAESSENLLCSEKENDKPIEKNIVKKNLLYILPIIFFSVFHYFITAYCFSTFDSSGIIRSYGTSDITFYPRTISIRSKPVTSNPCNASDLEVFENFVALWKEQNEAQMKLDKWRDVINESDTPSTIKEYYIPKIEVIEEKINASKATLESNFQIYKSCFLNKNDSLRSSIIIYYFVPWIVFNFLVAIYCPVQIHYSSYLTAKGLLERGELIKRENIFLTLPFEFGFITLLLTVFYYKITVDTVPEEFLV